MSEPTGYLLHNLLLFGRLLRQLGLDVNPGRMVDLVRALELVQVGRKSDFYYTARALLVHHHDDIPLFDQAFDLFWRKPAGDGVTLSLFAAPRPQNQSLFAPPALAQSQPPTPENEEGGEEQTIIEVTRTYSQQELLRRKDFAQLTAVELHAIQQLMRQMVWQLGQRRTRRLTPGQGKRLDLRRGLRQNLRYGGEWLLRPYRTPKYKPRPLVLLADISGSMERYTRLLIHFLYSLAEGLDQLVEAFVFSTRLSRITRPLHNRDVNRALDEVAHAVPDWAGGTRIGEALKSFNFDWGRRVLGHGAIVVLISDGWDRGDPELLRQEMARLQKNCHRLIWLNPLLGSPQYEPLTRGIQAALPFIDDFLPVHNLASLQDLAQHLQTVTNGQRNGRSRLAVQGAAFIKKG